MKRYVKYTLLLLTVTAACSPLWPKAGSLAGDAHSIEVPSEFWGRHILWKPCLMTATPNICCWIPALQ